MRRLIYSMGVSLDGFIAGPSGEIDWSAPDEELHRFHNEQARELGVHLCGRRLVRDDASVGRPGAGPLRAPATPSSSSRRSGRRCRSSSSRRRCERVEGNARLVRGDARRGGHAAQGAAGQGRSRWAAPGLASQLVRAGLDRRVPAVRQPGRPRRGIPFFPPTDDRIDLRLIETLTFGSKVVYTRGTSGRTRDAAKSRSFPAEEGHAPGNVCSLL